MPPRVVGALAIVSAYLGTLLTSALGADEWDGTTIVRAFAPVVVLLVVRIVAFSRLPGHTAGRAVSPAIRPLVVAAMVFVVGVAVLDRTDGGVETAAAVVAGVAAIFLWATPLVFAIRWLRSPW